jgi:hypothetical protein
VTRGDRAYGTCLSREEYQVGFTLREGILLRDSKRWHAVGVNYHPSAVGCRLWLDWDLDAIERDFTAMAAHRLNAVRVFVFWRHAEPQEGMLDHAVLARVRLLAEAAARRDLACVLSLFTIWMNGERLDLPWRLGRNLWRDPAMLKRGEAYVRAVARALRGLDNVLAIDLGDEIANADPVAATTLDRREVADWQLRMAGAAREELPGVLVCQANDVSGVLRAGPFGPDNGIGLDLHAVHGWPLWTPGAVESTESVKATQLSSFLVRYASAYGPALVDELGSYGTSEPIAAGYQRAAGAAAIAAGSLGVLAWCWQDIASTAPPYDRRPAERAAGLVRLDGTARPALAALTDTARIAALLRDFRPSPEPVAIYLPELSRVGASSYLDAPAGTIAAYFASLLLHRAGLPHRIVAAEAGPARLLVVPSATSLTLADRARLIKHLAGGGTVCLSVANHIAGLPDAALTGVEPLDFVRIAPGEQGLTSVRWVGGAGQADGGEWALDWARGPAVHARIRPTTAQVLAVFADGTVACTVNKVGTGHFVLVAFPLELQLDRPGALEATGWETMYTHFAHIAGITPEVPVPSAVEAVPGVLADRPAIVLVNHSTKPAHLRGLPYGHGDQVTVPAKGWLVATERGPLAQAG